MKQIAKIFFAILLLIFLLQGPIFVRSNGCGWNGMRSNILN